MHLLLLAMHLLLFQETYSHKSGEHGFAMVSFAFSRRHGDLANQPFWAFLRRPMPDERSSRPSGGAAERQDVLEGRWMAIRSEFVEVLNTKMQFLIMWQSSRNNTMVQSKS